VGFVPGLAAALPPSNRLIFDGDAVHIGRVRCPPHARDFNDPCTSQSYCLAFSRSAVTIRRARRRSSIEDPTVVSFYNQNQEYSRGELSPEGDRCDWFGFAPALVREAVRPYDPPAADGDELFRYPAALVPASVYLQQRVLFERVAALSSIDQFYIEENALGILADVIQATYSGRRQTETMRLQRAMEIADAAKQALARRSPARVGLQSLASEIDVSAFHLCRAFRRIYGLTIHRYIVGLRLRNALEALGRDRFNLSGLAMQLEFCHHSHFTAAFRTEFGAPPSSVRSLLRQPGHTQQHRGTA
jgi:AraC-like DNA-binding protein